MSKQRKSDNVEVGLLRMFLAVLEHGSIGKTAVAVEKTQPAISQQMLRLEQVVGQKLFTRGRDGIKLTRHGQLLATYAHRALELNDEILLRLRGETACRRMAVGMSADVALVGMASAIKHFQSLDSGLELSVIVAPPNRLDAQLKAGRLDCAIADSRLMNGTPTEKWSVQLEWAAGNNLDFDRSRPIPLVLLEGPCLWQDEMLDSLHRAGRDCRVAFETASLDAILVAVQSGLGIAALPAPVIREFALSHFHEIALPRLPQIEFGMFRADSAQTTSEPVQEPMFDSSDEGPTNMYKLVGDSFSTQDRFQSSNSSIHVRRRAQCRNILRG